MVRWTWKRIEIWKLIVKCLSNCIKDNNCRMKHALFETFDLINVTNQSVCKSKCVIFFLFIKFELNKGIELLTFIKKKEILHNFIIYWYVKSGWEKAEMSYTPHDLTLQMCEQMITSCHVVRVRHSQVISWEMRSPQQRSHAIIWRCRHKKKHKK